MPYRNNLKRFTASHIESINAWLHILILFIITVDCANSQPSFSKLEESRADFVSYSALPIYGGGMSFTDFDNDGWDDITLTTEFSNQIKFYKNHYGSFKDTLILPTNNAAQFYSIWIDYDNDGDKDFLSISALEGISLFKRNGSFSFTDETNNSGLSNFEGVHLRGGVCGDFNNDGLIDIYVCSFDVTDENRMYFQDSNNIFHDVTAITGTGNGLRHSFQSVIIDYNNDGYKDMFVANDYYEGTTLYRNNADSTFSGVSVQAGAYLELDAMGLAVGDYDGDLDLDIHITDRLADSKLLRNNNDGTFTEVGTEMGVDFNQGFGWGNNFVDVDADGDLDLYVSGLTIPSLGPTTPSSLFVNNNNGNSMTSSNILGDTLYSFSNTIGDFNNDRLVDIAVHNSANTKAVVWENETTTTNNSIKIRLEGCSSNRDGIGAEVYTFSNGVARLYSFHASQSFLGQNSSSLIIPIIGSSVMDSLRVNWPLGAATSLSNINSDQSINISECLPPSPIPLILVPDYQANNLTLCSNDSILLKLDGNYPSVIWSNGATTDSIFVHSGGTYSVSVTNQFGVSAISSNVTIIEREFPQYNIESELASCFNNGSIRIIPTEPSSSYQYLWADSSTTDSLFNLNPGVYYFTVTDQGACAIEDSIIMQGPNNYLPIRFNATSENVTCYGDSTGLLSINASGGSQPYEYLWSNGMNTSSINVYAGNYELTLSDTYNCQVDTTFSIDEPDQILAHINVTPDTNSADKGAIELDVFGGMPPYSISWNDPQNQTGKIGKDLIEGLYTAHIIDKNKCERKIDIYMPCIKLTNMEKSPNEKCTLTCKNLPASILVETPNNCSQSYSSSELTMFNLQGIAIQFMSKQISATLKEVITDKQGVFFIRDDFGRSCKVIRVNSP